MFDVSSLQLAIFVNSVLFALCLAAVILLHIKLKAGKGKLQQGWRKYNTNNKWYVRLLFADKLNKGYNDLQIGEKLYAKFMRIKRVLVIVLIIIAVVDLALIGLVFWA